IGMSEATFWLLAKGTWETIAMTFSAGFFSFLLGLPLGILLFLTRERQLLANKPFNSTIAFVVNIFRSIPFIILIVWMIPVTSAVVVTRIGMYVAMVPLIIVTSPHVARLTETCMIEMPFGIIEASRCMCATTMQAVRKAIIPEELPALINGAYLTRCTLVGY